MKASKLRVGNLVSEPYSNGVFKVVNINSEGFDYVDMHNVLFTALGRHEITSILPIPLTEEWLLRFGFEAKGKARIYKFIFVWLENEEFVFALSEPIKNKTHLTKLQHVHQLQNLYFALTGEELVLTDKNQPNEH